MRRKLWIWALLTVALVAVSLTLALRATSRDWLAGVRQHIASDQTGYVDFSRMKAAFTAMRPGGAASASSSAPPTRMRVVTLKNLPEGALSKLLERHFPKAKGWHWTNARQGLTIISKGPASLAALTGSPKGDAVIVFDLSSMADGMYVTGPGGASTAQTTVIEYHEMKPWEVLWVRARHIGSDPFDPSSMPNLFAPP